MPASDEKLLTCWKPTLYISKIYEQECMATGIIILNLLTANSSSTRNCLLMPTEKSREFLESRFVLAYY